MNRRILDAIRQKVRFTVELDSLGDLTANPMRYFIYCRKSSEAEDRQVLSLESQLNELHRAFDGNPEISIVDIYREAFSAKAPGRPLFDEMLKRIERGEADGIVAWHPDRLARNSVDGGKIIWFLDRKLIKDLKFATYTFENNPQGKFMLAIFLGQSKYYVDALSENVKRGNRTKIEKGWLPNKAPIGYLNCRETRTIIVDPERFPLVQRLFDLMATGAYSVRQLHAIARDEWGLRTPVFKKRGGRPLAVSSLYRILTNPFYAGVLVLNDQIYPGKHEPAITYGDFEVVQRILGRPHPPRLQKKSFAFTGLIRCGRCGLTVTAEDKVNRYGTRYTYYHCTRRNYPKPKCSERSVGVADLELQILGFLETLRLPESQHEWALTWAKKGDASDNKLEAKRSQSLERSYQSAAQALDNLVYMRMKDLISDEEFTHQREEQQREQLRLRSRLALLRKETVSTFEPVTEFISFSNRAVDWFLAGDLAIKRQILVGTGSNLTLTNKILRIRAKKPFRQVGDLGARSYLRALRNDVRTLRRNGELDARLDEIRRIIDICEPTKRKDVQLEKLKSLNEINNSLPAEGEARLGEVVGEHLGGNTEGELRDAA